MIPERETSTADGVALLGGVGGATLGPPSGGFMGPARAPGYHLEIMAGGEPTDITDIGSLDVNRRHTDISDWAATIPYQPALEDRVLSGVRLSWGDTILFRGRFEDITGEIGAPTVDISGPGIEAVLTRGKVTLDLSNVRRCDAIRQVWRQHTPFSAVVIEPDNPDHPCATRITTDPDDSEFSGTPMKVLKQLHEDSNMRFTVLHSRPGLNVESYPKRGRKREHNWDVYGGDRDLSAKGYANVVTVTGALKPDGSGERYRGVAVDETEVAAMRERGVGDDGRFVYPIDDPTIKNDQDMSEAGARTGGEKCQDKAESKLADLVDKDTVGGSLEVSPTVAAPGYDYLIEEFGSTQRAFGEGPFGEGPFGIVPGQYATLEKINYSVSHGDESCSLDLSQREGFADTLAKTYGEEI